MKRIFTFFAGYFVLIASFSQNTPPVAVNDTVEVVAQTPTLIDALANDYDPDGDQISINNWFNYHQSGIDTVEGKFLYKASQLFGENFWDYFDYQIIDSGNPSEKSKASKVVIHVTVNPDAPVAVPDTFEIPELVPVSLNILANDYDPNGDEMKIWLISDRDDCEVEINADSVTVSFIPVHTTDMMASFSYNLKERYTPEKMRSFRVTVTINLIDNPDIPVAFPDTGQTIGGFPVTIPVLDNDIDFQNEDLFVDKIGSVGAGSAYIEDDGIRYYPPASFSGHTNFTYRVREVNDSNMYSIYTSVTVYVTKNPNLPIGVPDNASGITFIPMTINLLSNDFDPNNEALEIDEVETDGDYEISGNNIIFTSNAFKTGHDTLYYRCRQKDHTDMLSEWTPVYIELGINPGLPVARDDQDTAYGSIPLILEPLGNDIKNSVDTLILMGGYSRNAVVNRVSDSTLQYIAYCTTSGPDTVRYMIRDKSDLNLRAQGYIYLTVLDQHFYDSLTINNISAGVNGDGMLFTKYNGYQDLGGRSELYELHFRYPKGSNTHTIFNSLLWIGGIAEDDSIHFAGERYRQIGNDFQPGPISNVYDSTYAEKFWKIWKLSKAEVEYHRNNWWKSGYEPVNDIARWPGNGDIASGQAAQLAPYTDFDQDGIYNPMNGDFPLIRGDQSVFFIYNDDRDHTEMLGNRFKAEIHGMVYGFDEPSDSALWNTVFVHYDIYNRSENTYHDLFTGIYTDLDLGNPWDDYLGSDVNRSSYYVYNGQDFDPDYLTTDFPQYGYGQYPPAQSVTFLAGPYIEPDGEDNQPGDCDYSVNGINFGNGIADDERMGLCHFIYFHSDFFWNQYPYYPEDCHNLMKGIWQDGSKCFYGGQGHMYLNEASVGPACNFMFPGDSDPFNWGTNCVLPNGGYNQNGFYWTDSSTAEPGDRSGLGTIGPITFEPGQQLELDIAYCAANGWNGPGSSIVQLMENIDSLRARVSRGEIIIPDGSLTVNEAKPLARNLIIYPNPAGHAVNVKVPGNVKPEGDYFIYNMLGDEVGSGHVEGESVLTLDVSDYMPGLYIFTLFAGKYIWTGKFVMSR